MGVKLRDIAEQGEELMEQCIQSEENSLHSSAYYFWTSLHIPGMLDIGREEEQAINHAILSAFIAGYTFRLTGEQSWAK